MCTKKPFTITIQKDPKSDNFIVIDGEQKIKDAKKPKIHIVSIYKDSSNTWKVHFIQNGKDYFYTVKELKEYIEYETHNRPYKDALYILECLTEMFS